MSRRLAALLLLACAALGCSSPPLPVVPSPAPEAPPLVVPSLDRLLPLAGLRWAVLVRPREITQIPWLIPAIGTFVPESRFDRFATATGVDLRQTPEALVASYDTEAGEALAELVKHAGGAATQTKIERAFADRLSADVTRSLDRPGVLRITGRIGREEHGFASLGQEVVCFQQGGSQKRGPCRIATLFAQDKLAKAKRIADAEAAVAVLDRLGQAPLRAFALGPFEGEQARAARGLAAVATAVGVALRPSAREGILVSVVVLGDFGAKADVAAHELELAWADVAQSSLGHLCGLDTPKAAPLAVFAPTAVTLQVELDTQKLAKGLADATVNEVNAIMR